MKGLSTQRKGQFSIQAILGTLIALILVIVVLIPTVNTAISDANFTGTTSTIMDTVPIFLAIGALVLSGTFFFLKGR